MTYGYISDKKRMAQERKKKNEKFNAFFNGLTKILQREFSAWGPVFSEEQGRASPVIVIKFTHRSSNVDFFQNVKKYVVHITDSKVVCSTQNTEGGEVIRISTTEEKIKTFKSFVREGFLIFANMEKPEVQETPQAKTDEQKVTEEPQTEKQETPQEKIPEVKNTEKPQKQKTKEKKETDMGTTTETKNPTKPSKRTVSNILKSKELKSGIDYISVLNNHDESVTINAKTVDARKKMETLLKSIGYELAPARKETQKSIKVLSAPSEEVRTSGSEGSPQQKPAESPESRKVEPAPKSTPVKETVDSPVGLLQRFWGALTEEERKSVETGCDTEDVILQISEHFVLIPKDNPIVASEIINPIHFAKPDDVLKVVEA